MTPKEKAKELVDKMYGDELVYMTECQAKQCALITVEEMITEVYNISHQYTAVYDITTMSYNYEESKELKFWKEVKQEIENL
jgi:hypothetical protein